LERNDHHNVDYFGEAPEEEANAFLAAHPDLCAQHPAGRVRLAIRGRDLLTESLVKSCLATGTYSLFRRRHRFDHQKQK
jgi:hypothetical protein